MKKGLLLSALVSVGFAGVAFTQTPSTGTASGLAKAQATVDNLPGDGAVKGDTQPKPNQNGQPASVFRPKPPPLKIKEPPLPPKKK